MFQWTGHQELLADLHPGDETLDLRGYDCNERLQLSIEDLEAVRDKAVDGLVSIGDVGLVLLNIQAPLLLLGRHVDNLRVEVSKRRCMETLAPQLHRACQ